MIPKLGLLLIAALLAFPALAQNPKPDQSWIAISNGYTNMLLDIEMKHSPEDGSEEGLEQYDKRVSQPTLADEDQERQENAAVLAKLKSAVSTEQQKEVVEDLQILIRNVELQFRVQDYRRAHRVQFWNASEQVFEGLRILLDEQTPRNAAPPPLSAFANTPASNLDTSR